MNDIWRSVPGKRPLRSREYRNWLKEAGWMVREQLTEPDCNPVPGRVLVVIGVERSSLLADIDNRAKATLDLLVEQHVIDDDRFVTGVAMAWLPRGTRRNALCRVMVMPAEPITLNFHPSPDGATGGWFIDALEQEEAA